MFRPSVLALFFLLVSTDAKSLSRSVFRSGDDGSVNLVEFNVRNVVYGKCSFDDDTGEHVEVIYEERGEEISARSANPTVIDPVSGVRRCRAAAAKPPVIHSDGTEGRINSAEGAAELQARFDKFLEKSASSQAYVQQLQPRFGGFFSSGISVPDYSQNVGVTLGGYDNDLGNSYPTLNIFPARQNSQTATLKLPFHNDGTDDNFSNIFPFGGFFSPFGLFGRRR